MKYYEIFDDVHFPGRWYLTNIDQVRNNWDFTLPEKTVDETLQPYSTKIYFAGTETDYTCGGYASIPYVSEKARKVILSFPNIEEQVAFYPVQIKDYIPSQPYYAMVIKKSPLCVDEVNSEFDPIEYEEGETSTSRGFLNLYPAFYKLVIDPTRTGNLDIFRLGGNSIYIIVSERLKEAFESAGVTGPKYTLITE